MDAPAPDVVDAITHTAPPADIGDVPDGSFIDGSGNLLPPVPAQHLMPVAGMPDVYAEVDENGTVIAYWKKIVIDGKTVYYLAVKDLDTYNPSTGETVNPMLMLALCAASLAVLLWLGIGFVRRVRKE